MTFRAFVPQRWYAPDAGGGDGPPPSPDGGDDKTPRTFTQQDVDALMGKTRKEARSAALSGVLEELGLKSVDELKTAFTEAKNLREAQLSEAEKLKLELDGYKTKMTEAEIRIKDASTKANERLMKAAVMAEAAKADYKITPSALADVWLFVDKSKLEMTDEGDVKGLPEALKAVLDAKPYLLNGNVVKGPDPTPKPNGDAQLTDEQRRQKAAQVRNYW